MKIRVSDRNNVGIWVDVYDNTGKYVKSMNISYKDWAAKYGISYHDAYFKKFDLK